MRSEDTCDSGVEHQVTKVDEITFEVIEVDLHVGSNKGLLRFVELIKLVAGLEDNSFPDIWW